MIRQELEASLRVLAASNLGEGPNRTLLDSLGKTAMTMLVPMTRSPKVAIPTFLFVALIQIFNFIYEKASDPVAVHQAELTARIAHLGNRIGDEFESAIKHQFAEVHAIQDSAVIRQATGYAHSAVPLFL